MRRRCQVDCAWIAPEKNAARRKRCAGADSWVGTRPIEEAIEPECNKKAGSSNETRNDRCEDGRAEWLFQITVIRDRLHLFGQVRPGVPRNENDRQRRPEFADAPGQ